MNVDMIVQNVSAEGHTDISFTLPRTEMRRAIEVLEPLAAEIDARGLAHDLEIAKISLVGAGMRTHPGVAADMFDALAEAGINIGIISTSPVRISCVVPAAQVERAVQAVHECFRLHEPVVSAEA
jgi:aspartate kinase